MKRSNATAAEDLTLAIGLLLRRMRAEAPTGLHELSWTQMAVLSRLEKNGPATMADLARAEGVKPQSMGTAVALLEQLDLVERKVHPTDGRQFNIKVTSKGLAMRKRTKEAKQRWLSEAIAKLEKEEQATLFKAGEIIKRMVELS